MGCTGCVEGGCDDCLVRELGAQPNARPVNADSAARTPQLAWYKLPFLDERGGLTPSPQRGCCKSGCDECLQRNIGASPWPVDLLPNVAKTVEHIQASTRRHGKPLERIDNGYDGLWWSLGAAFLGETLPTPWEFLGGRSIRRRGFPVPTPPSLRPRYGTPTSHDAPDCQSCTDYPSPDPAASGVHRADTAACQALREEGWYETCTAKPYDVGTKSIPTLADAEAFAADMTSAGFARVSVLLNCLGGSVVSRRDMRMQVWQALAFLYQNTNAIIAAGCMHAEPSLAEAVASAVQNGIDGSPLFIKVRSFPQTFLDAGMLAVAPDGWYGSEASELDENEIWLTCSGRSIFAYLATATGSAYDCGIIHLAALIMHEIHHLVGYEHDRAWGPYSSADDCCDVPTNAQLDFIYYASLAVGMAGERACDYDAALTDSDGFLRYIQQCPATSGVLSGMVRSVLATEPSIPACVGFTGDPRTAC